MQKETLYKNLFNKLGISETQSNIYEFLLKNGTATAGEISKKTSIKRSLVYNSLKELNKKNLILENKKNKVSTFLPNHPENLRTYIEEKEKEVQNIKISFDSILPNIINDFNSVSSKGSIKYMEGYDGLKKGIEYLFNGVENTDIKNIYNFSYMSNFVNDEKLNQVLKIYLKIRKEHKLYQQNIFSDTKKTTEKVHTTLEKYENESFLHIDYNKYPFSSDITLFNNKILIVSSRNNLPCITFIENEELYKTLKSVFELVWKMHEKKED